jgi:hypothetical protein
VSLALDFRALTLIVTGAWLLPKSSSSLQIFVRPDDGNPMLVHAFVTIVQDLRPVPALGGGVDVGKSFVQ